MGERTFTGEDGTVVPLKTPEFEVIEVGEVERRMRAELKKNFDDSIYELLATVLVIWVPPPTELGEHLRQAILGLEGILEFFAKSKPDERSSPQWRRMREDLSMMEIALGMQRDRVERVCDHKVLEPAPDAEKQFDANVFREAAKAAGISADQGGTLRCKRCHLLFRAGTSKPPRFLSRRPILPKDAVARLPGRGAFLFFVTELLRLRLPKIRKFEAMNVAAKLIALFWSDGDPPQDHQLEDLHRAGKESAKETSLISPQEFLGMEFGPENVKMHLVWVPIGKGNADASEVGST